MSKRLLLVMTVFLACSSFVTGQNRSKLSTLIPGLFGTQGVTLAPPINTPSHQAHFSNASTGTLSLFNASLMQQLTALPLPSPASGFTYTLDPGMGTLTRSAQSFGPVLSERAETIGRHKFTVGISYQHFSFDKLEGEDLDSVPAVLGHIDIPDRVFDFENDVVTTDTNIDLSVDEVIAFFTFGLTDRLDVSLAVPIVRTDLSLSSTATVQRIGTANDPLIHRFPGDLDSMTETQSETASGIGDIVMRVKGTVKRWEHAGFALAADVRFPTGDEEDLLGTGAFGFKPFAVMSFPFGRFSPHVNIGYQFNGDSILAGDPVAGVKSDLPDQFLYIAGVDIGVHPKATVAFDFLGQRVIDSQRVQYQPWSNNGFTSPNISFLQGQSFNQNNGAVSVKFNPVRQLLVDFSLIFRLDDAGLRDDLTPLIGASYTF